MANEAIGGFFYFYITWLGPEEAFLQFYFFKKKFLLKNDIFLLIITVDELGVKLNLRGQKTVKDFRII
jgi:hypothetical protein